MIKRVLIDILGMSAVVFVGSIGLLTHAFNRWIASNNYAEIIVKNESGQGIDTASIDHEKYHLVVNDIPPGQESARIMYEAARASYETKIAFTVVFADGSKLREDRWGVGDGEKITVVVASSGVSTILRQASP